MTGKSPFLKKNSAKANHIEGIDVIDSDSHLVKIWTLAHLHHRIVQLESYAEIARRKSSLDVFKTKIGKV